MDRADCSVPLYDVYVRAALVSRITEFTSLERLELVQCVEEGVTFKALRGPPVTWKATCRNLEYLERQWRVHLGYADLSLSYGVSLNRLAAIHA